MLDPLHRHDSELNTLKTQKYFNTLRYALYKPNIVYNILSDYVLIYVNQ